MSVWRVHFFMLHDPSLVSSVVQPFADFAITVPARTSQDAILAATNAGAYMGLKMSYFKEVTVKETN